MNIKKSILALAAAVLPFTAFAQPPPELSIDFESASQYKNVSVYDWCEGSPFYNHPENGNCDVVSNPYTQPDEVTGVPANASSRVLGIQRSKYGSNMFGARIELNTPLSLSPTTKYIHVKMHRPEGIEGRVMLIGLGKHSAQAVGAETTWKDQTDDIEQFTVIGNQKPAPGYWSDIVFPVKTAPDVDIYSLVVCIDCESPHRLSEDFIAYIDDIEVNNSSRPAIALRGDYAVCFDKEVDQQTHNSRMYNNISVTTNAGTFVKKANGKMGLTEAFDGFIPVKRGTQVSITPGYSGSAMHSFVYFDANNNGRFEENDGEMVSCKNSNGNDCKATHTFTIPEDQTTGVYRIRTKVDWSSTDPAGNADASNFILNNGGGMIDALLYVYDEVATVNITNTGLNGDIIQSNGEKINNLAHPRGTALPVQWLPETGFECSGIELTIGIQDGDEFVHGNPQRITLPKISYRQFDDDGRYTIPAELLYTDVNIEDKMVEQGQLPKPEFIPTSKAPLDGKFRASSRALTLKVKNGYMSTASGYTDGDGYLKLTNGTEPTDAKGYWVVCGDDENGYQIYNVEAGTGKVLGFTGSEAGARAKLYDVNSIPANVTTRFDYKASTYQSNPYKAAANRAPARAAADAPQLEVSDFNTTFRLHGSTNNCWNDRDGYLALWPNNAAFGNDGSAIVVHDVEYDFENPDNNVTPEPPVTPAVDTYQKGELITSQGDLTEGMLVILDVKAKQAPSDAHLYYTVENTTNKFDRNNFKAHTDDHNNQYPATDVWKVVNVAGSTDAARFQLQSVSDPTVFLPRGTRNESNNEAANFYLSEATGFAADGITRFALRFDNPGAAQDTYHFNSRPGAGVGEVICFWGYSSTSNDSQGSFAIYKAETEAAPEPEPEAWESRDWTPSSWVEATSAENTSNFYEAVSQDVTDVTVAEAGNVTTTITHRSGNHRQVLFGAELLKDGEIVAHDYHLGSAGGNPVASTYTFENVVPGTYTVRCWTGARSDNSWIDSSGDITIGGAATAKTVGYNKQNWVMDNSYLTDELKSQSYMSRVGTNNYKHMDVTNVAVAKDGTLDITYAYSTGTERLDIIGVELLDSKTGQLIETQGTFDGHYGFTGNQASKNTYTIYVPKGEYTLRTWAMYVRPITSSGTISYAFTPGKNEETPETLPLTEVNGLWVAPSLTTTGEFASNTVWYTIKNYYNGDGGVYNYMSTADGYMEDDGAIKLSVRNADDTDAGLWCLVGDATNGYKFYNKQLGTSKVLSTVDTNKGAMVSAEGATKCTFTFEFSKNQNNVEGWYIRDGVSDNDWWNQSGGYIKHWGSSFSKKDNNSLFVFETECELPTPEPVDPDNNLDAYEGEITSQYPFLLSTSADDMHWHYLTIRGNKYVSYNANTQQFDNSTTAPTGDAGLFAFVPVSENGVKIVNKAAGLTKALGGNVSDNALISAVNYADAKTFIYQNNSNHYVFAIEGAADNAHVNDIKDHLGYWVNNSSATDAGSTFTFAPTEVLISTDEVKHYYTIRNANPDGGRSTHYAHYVADNAKLALNATRDNSTVFYFTSAGENENGFQKVQIHNYTADGLTMNGWDSWAATNPMTWYVRPATGTTDILMDFNIANTMTNIDSDNSTSWNHQTGGIANWHAGNDKGSAWYLEEVKERTYSISIVGADETDYTLYNNGEAYTNGDEITGFFFAANNFTTDPEGQHPFDGVLTTEDGTLVFSFNEFNTVTPGQRPADISDYALWYDEPATKTSASDKWMEYALPLGNGQIGATFLGGLMTDNIQFNEKTLWRGGPSRGADGGQGYFQNFGSILVRDLSGAFSASSDAKPATGYARYLDIMNGVGGVRYNSATTHYKRNYFTSAPDKVLVAHYTAEGTDKLNLLFSYAPDTQINASAVTYDGAEATFSGKLHVVKYNTRFRVLSDGTVSRTDEGIKVTNGTYATLVMAAATDYDAAKAGSVTGETAEQLATRVSDRLGAAAAKSYDKLLAAHVTNFSGLMGRVDIDFGGETSLKTTEELIKFYNQSDDNKLSADGLYLEQLYFQYGRYMTIGANNDLSIHAPSNLQGIWNDRSNSNFWHCDVHADINVEMNYWPADPTNLSEMHRPFLDHILDMAREDGPWSLLTHGNPGWTIDCENNIFGGTSGWSQNDMKTLGAWYCSHLWRYYRYTKDREFLKKALPVMYRNAVYLKSIATLDTDNTYVIPGEWSPEHSDFNTITAFAQQTTAEVCDEIIKAHAELDTESTLTDAQVAEISAFYDKLDKGIKIENYTFTRAGKTYTSVPCIAEWKKIALKDPGHRHLSHLMCIYPFEQISAYDEADAANFAAARNGILARTGDVTGWSMGWQTNVYARCLWGNEARGYLSQALRHSPNYGIAMGGDGGCYYNLFDAHSPFQIDGNYGCTSGVAEMLVQSYDDKVHLLPALPNAWADGHAKGLKAIGNFTVDQEWAGGELTSADITSNVGGKLEVVYGNKKATIDNTRRGETYHFDIVDGKLTYNLVDATIVTITDYIDGARNGGSYDAQKLEDYKKVILKK